MIRNRGNAPHCQWGDGCNGWRLHEDDDVGVIEELVPTRVMEDAAALNAAVLDGGRSAGAG